LLCGASPNVKPGSALLGRLVFSALYVFRGVFGSGFRFLGLLFLRLFGRSLLSCFFALRTSGLRAFGFGFVLRLYPFRVCCILGFRSSGFSAFYVCLDLPPVPVSSITQTALQAFRSVSGWLCALCVSRPHGF